MFSTRASTRYNVISLTTTTLKTNSTVKGSSTSEAGNTSSQAGHHSVKCHLYHQTIIKTNSTVIYLNKPTSKLTQLYRVLLPARQGRVPSTPASTGYKVISLTIIIANTTIQGTARVQQVRGGGKHQACPDLVCSTAQIQC